VWIQRFWLERYLAEEPPVSKSEKLSRISGKLLDVWFEIGLGSSTYRSPSGQLEVPMIVHIRSTIRRRIDRLKSPRSTRPTVTLVTLLIVFPLLAHAQAGGSPFDTRFTAMQNLFTGTVAKVASLIAIVVGGYQFAHGEPGAKKALAGVAAGTGIAVLATNILAWLWGI